MSTPMIPEARYEAYFRARPFIVPIVTYLTLLSLLGGVVCCMIGFQAGHYWTIVPSALLAHAYFIIAIHDQAHRSITHSVADDVLMNVFAGLMLLPFFAEPFRRYHMIHHGNTNNENDPLWSPLKDDLYTRSRFLYMLCQFIPMLFSIVVLASGQKARKKKNINGPEMRFPLMILAFVISGVVLYFVHVPLFFYLGSLFLLTVLGAVRHWSEHMGTTDEKESNTFWFPLGMGVGNHDVHHQLPSICWLSLALGLRKRKIDTHPLKTIKGILFDRKFKHYQAPRDSKL